MYLIDSVFLIWSSPYACGLVYSSSFFIWYSFHGLTSSSIGFVQVSPCDGCIDTINFCQFPFILILSLSSYIDSFIFIAHGRTTSVRKELDPSLGLMISNLTWVVIPLMFVSRLLHTPVQLILGWLVLGKCLTHVVVVYQVIPMCHRL